MDGSTRLIYTEQVKNVIGIKNKELVFVVIGLLVQMLILLGAALIAYIKK